MGLTVNRQMAQKLTVNRQKRMLLIPGTGNGERGTGNGEPGTGVWELMYSGNPLKIQNGGQNKRNARRETIWVKVNFHRLCPQMVSTFL